MSSDTTRNVFIPAVIGTIVAMLMFSGGYVRKLLIGGIVFILIFFILKALHRPTKSKVSTVDRKESSAPLDPRKWLDDLLVKQQKK